MPDTILEIIDTCKKNYESLKTKLYPDEKERALHFLPPNTNIHEHMHNIDAGTSEIYIVWNNDKEKWEAISISKDVAGPWKEDPSHSAEASEKEPSLIFGAKRRIRRTRMDRQYKYI